MMSPALRHRITIQSQVETQDPVTGEAVISWTDFQTNVPAEVLTGPGREFKESASGQAEVSARIKVRWFPGLSPTMRILWGEEIYNIRAFSTDITGRGDYRIICTGGVNSGAN